MSYAPAMVEAQSASQDTINAGFWRRVLAWIIDWVLVSASVLMMFLLLAAAIPGLAKVVTLKAPFDLFTTERTLESKTTETKKPNGVTVAVTEKIVERTVVGQWNYLYRITETKRIWPNLTISTTKRQQLDLATREDIKTAELDGFILILLMVYWTLMESSRFQASFGKLALGMTVTDMHGKRLTIPRAAGRNLLKFLSALILFIGFFMAAWTRRKQALHDRITTCYVVVSR